MDQPFSAAPSQDVLVFLVEVAVLLLTARALGEVAQRLGQPTVVGEILAGIVLGPSLLSGVAPAVGEWIVPQTAIQGHLLELVSLLGVMFLLLSTGLETDLGLIRSRARSAVSLSLGGLTVTLSVGFLLGQLLPMRLLVEPGDRLVFALFLATAMAISAIPVVAKVLVDLNLMRRDMGQTLLAAAMIDDTTGWIILSVVIGLASGRAVTLGSVAESIGTVLAFMALSLSAGRWMISRLLTYVQNHLRMRDKVLSLVVLVMFTWGALGQALGIEALLGAFVAGIVLSQIPHLNPDVIRRLESISLGIFAPIFFATAGLEVDARRLLEPDLLAITIGVIGVAILCKTAGVYAGARWIGGSDHWTALFFGAGLNARGSIGIIVASIGLSLGILNQDVFSMIVVMAIVTSVISPPVMKWVARKIEPHPEEAERLRREELSQDSLIANVRRVLLPVRVREGSSPLQLIEARVLERLSSRSNLALTLLTVSNGEDRARSADHLDELAEMFSGQTVTTKVLVGADVEELILDEAEQDYDLMILGASEKRTNSEVLFSPVLDCLVRMAPCPTILVQGGHAQGDWKPTRILVPSNGSQFSRRAAEVAFALVNDGDAHVTILQVVEENRSDYRLDATGALVARQKQVAQKSVEALRELGQLWSVTAQAEVRVGTEPEAVILNVARTRAFDLIVLGTNVSVGSSHLYLGPRVERILINAPCPVIVVNS